MAAALCVTISITALSIMALAWVNSHWKNTVPTQVPALFSFGHIQVIDGDTIRSGGHIYRLVGFDTPETVNPRCERERNLADAATRRLRELVAGGELNLARVPCACRPGTEGTPACNYGRLCARLTANGRDVGTILMGEGLAQAYICSGMSCPPRPSWCG